MTAPMSISPLVQVREIPDEASLSVLGHSGEGVVAACEEDRAAQVDGTGQTTINMLFVIYPSHLMSTQYRIPS